MADGYNRAMPRKLNPPQADAPWFVTAERFTVLLDELTAATRELDPPPDSVIGAKRSGLFPAVYLSYQLRLPMFTSGELASFPADRLMRPLLVDTMAWSGGGLRSLLNELERLGVGEARVLVMFAREPLPPVRGLHYLHTSDRIVHFWYELRERQAEEA
jgi:hypothetical protein